jgi:hypothetical protein
MEQMVQKFQQVMEHKLEVQAIRFQQAMDRVDTPSRKIEHVEWVHNSRFQQAKMELLLKIDFRSSLNCSPTCS